MSYDNQIDRVKDFLDNYKFGIICLEEEALSHLLSRFKDDPYFRRFEISPSIDRLEKTAQEMQSGEVLVLITNDFTSGFQTILNNKGIKGLVMCTKANIPARIAHTKIQLEV